MDHGDASPPYTLAATQKRAAITISGAFRVTAREALEAELALLPLQHLLPRLADETAIRLWTCPCTGYDPVLRTTEEKVRSGRTPLEAHAC